MANASSKRKASFGSSQHNGANGLVSGNLGGGEGGGGEKVFRDHVDEVSTTNIVHDDASRLEPAVTTDAAARATSRSLLR